MQAVMPRNVLLAALLLASTACARFENPISTAQGTRFDATIAGNWVGENENGPFEMAITRNGDEGHILFTGMDDDGKPATFEMRLVTARLDQQTFGSVADVKEGSNWFLFRYELLPPDRLIIYYDNDKFWDEAVRNKLVAGSDLAANERNARVTASSEELGEIVRGYGSVIFDDQPGAELRRK